MGLRRTKAIREWKILYNEELNHLYASQHIIQVIKLRRMRCTGQVACMGERRGTTGFWWRNLRARDHLEDTHVDRRIISQWIFKKWDGA